MTEKSRLTFMITFAIPTLQLCFARNLLCADLIILWTSAELEGWGASGYLAVDIFSNLSPETATPTQRGEEQTEAQDTARP